MLWEFGTNSVQLRERKNGFLVPKRHRMKHLDFLSFLLEAFFAFFAFFLQCKLLDLWNWSGRVPRKCVARGFNSRPLPY